MFKKLIIALISTSFVASAAFADVNAGFRISIGDLSASGTSTTNQSSAVTHTERSADFEMGFNIC